MKLLKILLYVGILGMLACGDDELVEPDEEQTLNDIIITVTDFETAIDENPEPGFVLGSLSASVNEGELTFELTNENPSGALMIASSGEISVLDNTLFDYEVRQEILATVSVNSGDSSKVAQITVNLQDLNDAQISAQGFELSMDENPDAEQYIGQVTGATDQGTLMFTLTNENPIGGFSLDQSNGNVSVNDAALFDFETRTTLSAEVLVSVGEVSTSVPITVNLNDLDEVPQVPFDGDMDGLIDVYNINQLAAILYDLNGDGKSDATDDEGNYLNAYPNAVDGQFEGYELMSDLNFLNEEDYADASVMNTLTTNLGWVPLGNSSSNFDAIFEGNGFTIHQLYIGRGAAIRIGLFGMTSRLAEIRNLGLKAATVQGRFSSGVLVGENWATVKRCYAMGTLESSQGRIGGLIGSNFGDIFESYANVDISAETADYVGGLIGLAFEDNNRIPEVSDCYATGDVVGRGVTGGLVGGGTINISNSYSTGLITSEANQVGGLIGFSSGTVTDSYWDTDTSGRIESAAGEGLTSAQLLEPTSATGIYESWSADSWDFGTTNDYPLLKNVAGGIAGQNAD